MQTDTKTPPAPAPTAGKPTANSGGRARTPGVDLVPRIDPNSRVVQREHFYWVGALPACPTEHVDLCGVNFPKMNENIVPDPMRTDKKARIPVIGTIVRLTEEKLKLIQARLKRTVVRFYEDRDQKDEPGTGENIGDVHQRARRGQVITIPREEDVVTAEKAGRNTRRYVPDRRDEPVARYLFMRLCENQVTGNRGEHYPDPLEVSGLEWPEEAVTKK